MTTRADELREKVAIAISMADPDERSLPLGMKMAVMYREIADAALSATALYLRANARSLAQHDDTAGEWVEKIIGLIEEAGRG